MIPQVLVQSDSTNSRTGPDAYCRDLTLDERIKCIHDYFLAKVWYLDRFTHHQTIGCDS